jgi:hypothetical protein
VTDLAVAGGAGATVATALVVESAAVDDPAGQALVPTWSPTSTGATPPTGRPEGDSPEMVGLHAVRADQVVPPHGVSLTAWPAGEPVGCGALRPLHSTLDRGCGLRLE